MDEDEVCPTTGKRRFADKAAAKAELRNIKAKRDRGLSHRNENRAYSCTFCFGWHLSSSERRGR